MRRLLAALVLAMIGLQALPSGAATFQPHNGSAFSAATVDVALAPPGRAEAASLHPNQPLPSQIPADAIVNNPVVTRGGDAMVPSPDPFGPLREDAPRLNRAPRPPPVS